MTAHSQTEFFSDDSELKEDCLRVLRRLCETDAQLVLASDMDKAVVLRGSKEGKPTRTAVVDRKTAQSLAINDWVKCQRNGRVSTYVISSVGRAALKRSMQVKSVSGGDGQGQKTAFASSTSHGAVETFLSLRPVSRAACVIIWPKAR